ncbi:MAG: amino acid permease [Gammaproteobacteria bacterium]|nr:amino acid permease [Gammaproteobacteria bacterium]
MNELKRSIGLPLLLFFGLGNILGAGIYVLIGKIAAEAGLFTPIAFFIAALVAAFSAFTYSELSARYSYSSGVASYVAEGFHTLNLTRLTGLLVASVGVVTSATIARGFHGYLSVFFSVPEWLSISVLILTLGLLTIWGITQSVSVVAVMTVVEIAGLLLVIWAGKDALVGLPAEITTLTPPADADIWIGILMGAFLAFFAFTGFEDMVTIAEEVKKPAKTLPAGIILSLFLATVLYALVALVAILTLDQTALSASHAPLTDVIIASSDINPSIITLISIFAIINGALIQMIMVSRMLYGMAAKGWIWHGFAEVNASTQTPIIASLVVIAIILGLALWFPLVELAKTTSFLLLTIFSLVNASLIRIKLYEEEPPSGIIINPIWVPVLGLITSFGLIVFQLFNWLTVLN